MIKQVFFLIITFIVVNGAGLREEDDRDVLHWTPLGEYMGLITAYHSYGTGISSGNHIYYLKAYGSSSQTPQYQKLLWGHIVTYDGVTFTNGTDDFFSLDDEASGYDDGAILRTNMLSSLDASDLIAYQVSASGSLSSIVARTTSDPNMADLPNNNAKMTIANSGSPALVNVSNTAGGTSVVLARFSNAVCDIAFSVLTYSTSNKVISVGQANTYTEFQGVNCAGLNVVQLFSETYMILRSSEIVTSEPSNGPHYASYIIVTITVNNNVISIVRKGGPATFDYGHDGHNFKFTRSDDKVSGFGWAGNKGYTTSLIPTTGWKNGMTVMRSVELKEGNQGMYLAHSFNLGTPVRTFTHAAVEITLEECKWSHNFASAWQLVTLQSGAFVFDLKFDVSSITGNGNGYRIQFLKSGSESGNSIYFTAEKTGSGTDYTFTFDREKTKGISEERTSKAWFYAPLTKGDVKIILDRTTVEIFIEDGLYTMTEKYYLTDIKKVFDTICITAINNPIKMLGTSKVEKYQSIWIATGSTPSITMLVAVVISVVGLFMMG